MSHPEVFGQVHWLTKLIGFLTLLYAGTTSIYSFKYSILNDIVTRLKQGSISAGNLIYNIKIMGTSETLRNETAVENIKPVSVHVPTHFKPVNDDQFVFYLAGLIDGNSYFNSKQELVIIFNTLNASLAYYVKKKLGFGSVKKVKNAFILIINSKGLERAINLIQGKIQTENKYNQIINYFLNCCPVSLREPFNFNSWAVDSKDSKDSKQCDFKNSYLAGLTDAKGSFQLKLTTKESASKLETDLNLEIEIASKPLLFLVKSFWGGNITYNKSKNTYNYNSTSLGSAKKVINYLDHFHLLSNKQVHYLKWRKAYLIIQNCSNDVNKASIASDKLIKLIKIKNTLPKADL